MRIVYAVWQQYQQTTNVMRVDTTCATIVSTISARRMHIQKEALAVCVRAVVAHIGQSTGFRRNDAVKSKQLIVDLLTLVTMVICIFLIYLMARVFFE